MENKICCFSIILFCYFTFTMIVCAQKLPVNIQRDRKAHITSRFYCSGRICYMVAFSGFQNDMTEIFFLRVFLTASGQSCYQKDLDYATFAMMESNYDAFADLDLREYAQVFTAFSAYQTARQDIERKNYDVCASDYDEDGNEVEEPSYNEYGDYVVYRPNSTSEKPIYGLPVNYTVNAFPKETYIDSANAEFQKFMDQGIKVYFTYSPRNKYALSKESTEEERARLHEYFKSQLHIPVISELEDSLYTGIYLYGTDNHLSTEGAQIRTERVIRDLKEQLAKEEKE